jgi:hypothetical protein
MTLEELQFGLVPHSLGGTRLAAHERVKRLTRVADLEETVKVLKRIESLNRRRIVTESGMLTTMTSGSVPDEQKTVVENLTDVSGNAPVSKTAGVSVEHTAGQKQYLDVHDFFQRPVQIGSFSWASGNIEQRLRVWDLYTLNNAVRAKLRNYAYVKANLHVRIAIAGTPFHYGRVLVSYQPYDQLNRTLINYNVAEAFTTDLYQNMLAYLSQAPGAFTMDIKDNMPVELTIPFISTKPAHRLFGTASTAIAAASSYPDLYDAGCLYIQGVTGIGSVSGTFEPVSFYVYAWMTEVELGAPTATIVGITTEGRKADERKVGPIEKVAMRAAEASEALSVIPDIGPYAMASSMVLRGLGNFAALFGWSKPIPELKPMYVKNLGFQNNAPAIGYDTTFKLALDPKQELNIDPRLCGSTQDELAISSICKVQSYFTYFPWAQSDVVMAAPIFAIPAYPYHHSKATHTAVDYYQPTALAFAAAPFGWWRGDITFTFEIVCSAFHRGKLAIYYEPNVYQNVLINATLTPNKQFMKIVDISETQLVSFTVKWAAHRQWLMLDGHAYTYVTGGAALTTYDSLYNGYVGVVPMNKLTSPDGSSVQIMVHVHSDNMHFTYPMETNLPNKRQIVTSSRMLNSVDSELQILNESTASEKDIAIDHFGEQCLSFRSLLKRYMGYNSQSTTTGGGVGNYVTYIWQLYPDLRVGYSTSPSGNTPRTIYDYLRYAYMGIRGSMRQRMQFITTLTNDNNAWVYAGTNAPSTYAANSAASTTTTSYPTLRGTGVWTPASNAGIEYEVPFFSDNLFVFSFDDRMDGSTVGTFDTGDMNPKWVRTHSFVLNTDQSSKAIGVVQHIAAGEDFDFLRFQGAPYWTV